MDNDENALIKKLFILWKGRNFILILTIIFMIFSIAYALYLPPIYKAECYFLPPNQDMSKLSNIYGSVTTRSVERVGALADLNGLPTTVTGGQIMLAILKRNAVLDVIIDRFALMQVYKQKQRSKMRELIIKKLLETQEDTKSGIVSVGVLDENPSRAAAMANAFVETLQKKMLDLSLNEAVQRKVFFEEQVNKTREALHNAEKEMLDYQNKLGIAIPESQLQARLNSITELQRDIAAKRVEISALSTYARPDNPRLKVANSQLEALIKQLERLENEQRTTNPQLSVEYQRYVLNLELATKTYEAVLKQYEAAKLDEAQGFFPLQVVDYATVPDTKYKPSRARIVILGSFIGFVLGCLIVVMKKFLGNLTQSVKNYAQENDDDYENDYETNNKKSNWFKKLLAFTPAILIIAAIAILTFQTKFNSEELSSKFQMLLKNFLGENNTPDWVLNMQILRSLVHIPMYLTLSLAIYVGFFINKMHWFKAILITLSITATIGFFDEAVKVFLPNREFDVIDWIFDILGSLAGISLILALKLFCSILKTVFNKHSQNKKVVDNYDYEYEN